MYDNYNQLDMVALIDLNDFFIEDVERKNLKPDSRYVETRCPSGLYHPRWTGTEWIETMTEAEYIATLPKQPEREPTTEERLTQLETLVVNNISNQIENQILKGES